MYKFLFVTLIFIIANFSYLQAQQFPQDYWHEGEITLFDGQVFQGIIKYDNEKDNVQITSTNNGSIKTYSSRNVESFEFIDSVLHIKRSFFTLPFEKSQGYESPTFFELLTDGKVAFLGREIITISEEYVSTSPMGQQGYYRKVRILVDNLYFLIKSEQKVIKFDKKKDTILQILGDKKEKVQQYLANNKVNLSKRQDLMQLLDYYNSL